MDLGKLTRKEMIALCEEKGIKITGQPKKEDLISILSEDIEAVIETAEIVTDDSQINEVSQKETKSHKVLAKYIGKAGRIYEVGEFDNEVLARKHLLKLGAKGNRVIIE